jgi:probable F420-dependent oxidoreductase
VTTRKFRFGVQAASARTASEWAEQARKIEDLGYSTLFMPDHFAETPFAPMAALPFAAAATTTLRIGMLVLGNDYKHPAVVAKEAATLDVLSDGRLEFGLGAGWMTADYEALGLTYDRPGVRIERLAEALAIVKGAWADGPFDFQGEHYTITGYDAQPTPVQRPRPPILVGGGGPKLLRLAGREADIVGINPILHAGVIGTEAARDTIGDSTARKIGWVREGAGGPVRRHRAADPLLRSVDHRRRERARQCVGARVRDLPRRRLVVGLGPGRIGRRGVRHAPCPPGGLGRHLRGVRRRPVRAVRSGRGPTGGDVTSRSSVVESFRSRC